MDENRTSYDDNRGERVVEGLRFKIAGDRKVERVDGDIETEGLDKYLKVKFDRLFNVLESIEERLSAVESRISDIQSSMEHLSEQVDYIKDEPQQQVQLEFR